MKGKQQQDFRTEKYIRYGIRKYSFGAASVAIAAGLMFLGNGAVSATEVQNAETTISATASGQDDKEKEKAEPKAETVEAAKAAEVKAVETKKVNKAILEASIATLESKLSTAKYADATVVNSAKEVLATAKATLAKEDASQADVDAQAETVSALSTVVTESNTAGFDKKQAAEKEAAKAEAEKKATPAEKALSVAKTTLTQVSSEAEVTNKLAETELAKADVKEENKAAVTAAVAKNQAVLAETKALLADKSVTKEQVDAQLERLNESILAVYNELKNAGIGRDGKFAVNLDETQTTALKDSSTEAGQKWLADHGYSSLADIPIMNKGKDDKEIKEASKQIQWLDFTDTKAWTGLDDEGQLKIGSTFKKELIPGYVVTLTVKEMKPFHATETYKNRVAGTASEDTYNPDAVNSFKKATGIGGSAQTRWAHVKNAGFDTVNNKTTIAGTNDKSQQLNGTIAGVVFSIDAEYNGKKTKPTILMTSGEDIKINESEIYTTNGTPWDLYALVGNEKETNPYIPNVKMRNVTSPQEFRPVDDKLQKALVNSAFSTPDTATAGLGSQVFGSYINGENGSTQATPIVTTSGATEVGFYIISGGAQSSMIGISLSDFGDLPESYGKAEHSLKTSTTNYKTGQTEEIQQPYLGKVKADPDAQSGERVRGIGSDDATDSADEGVAELISEKDVHINKDNGEPEVKIVQAADNTYRVRVIASANGNDNYTGTVEPAYVRGFIDFNNNGKFDEDEASNIVEVTGKDQEVELVFSNTQVIDTTKDKVNFRTRIAKSEKQVTKAIGTAFSGEVEDNQIQVSLPPRGDKEKTTGKQGEKQSVGIEFISRVVGDDASDLGSNNGKTTFNSYGKLDYSEQSNTISAETTKKKQPEGVMIVNPDGRLTKTFTKEGQGTYEVTDTGITFTPEANFVGKADGIVLRAVDANGQSTGWTALTDQNQLENINDGTHTTTTKTMDAVYIPTVTPKEITAEPKTSIDVQGKEQKETPVFKTDAGKDNEAVITPSATHPAKLIDPVTKAPTDAKTVTVDGEGTYTINPTTGEVTFQPLPTFTGKAKGVGVSLTAPVGVDKTGAEVTSTATTTYTPEVTPVTPTADPATSTGIQGETQTGTPTFTAGNAAVPIKTGSVKLLNADGTEAQGAVPALDPNGNKVGEYTVDPTTGVVTFTPTDKTYVGPVEPAKVQAEDNNGTKVETKYTPSIVGVKPTATPADSSNIQGAVQSGVVAFAPGKVTIEGTEKSVAIKENSAVLLDKQGNKVAAGTPVDAEDENGNKVGEYTIDPATNTVTFTPTNKAYKGKVLPANVQAEDENGTTVKTTYTPNIVGVTPTAEPADTTDVQGVEQSKEVTFKPGKTTINGEEKEVPIDTTSFKLLDETGNPVDSVPAKNPAGDVIGTYTLKVVDGKPTAVFTPTDKTYAGEVKPVTIQAKDTNGTPVTTTYTPNITPVAPTGTPTTSEGVQGQPQEGTPTFTQGDAKVPMKIDNEQPAKLIDPATGNPTDETTIPAKDAKGNTVGTYTIEPTTGKVTFTPNKDFTGTPVPATVQAKDANGTPATATYTPTVKPVTPEGINTFTEDIQGAPQSGKPQFTPGKTTINGKEVEVPMDDNTPAKLVDPTTGQEVTSVTIPGEGTYTVDADGTVHFTPDKQFTGKGQTLKVVRQDTNGTKVTAEYTAVVKPATPEGTEVLTAGVQGKEQSGRPNFVGGKAEVNGVEKTVDIDTTKPAKLIDPTTNQEVDKVVIPGEGTYTVAEDGTVTFTPEKGFVGKGTELTVKRVDLNGTPALGKYTAVVIGTKPTAEPSVTSDIQGQTQSQPVKFKGGTVEVEDPITKAKTQETVAIDPSTYTLLDENGQAAESVPAKNPAGEVVGTYTLVKEEGKDPVAVFTPSNKSYTGEVKPVTVQAKDTNGVAVTTTYTPNITPVKPTAKSAVSEGAQGQEQSGTPTFTEGHTKAPIDTTVPAKLIDPKTGQPTDEKSVTVPGEGTYTVAEDGTVTFKPEPNFTGKATGVEVQRVDTNGTPATAKYTPTVKPVTPTSDDAISEDIQGAKQTGTPVFTPGKTTINGQEVTVELDPAVKPSLVGADEEGKVVVPNEGTYTIDENGVVTFTPEPNFTGKASGVTVKRADKNGTEVTAKYTPTVKPVTPTAKDTTTTDVQGVTQKGKPEFTPGKATVNGVEKTVDLSDKPAKLVDPKTGDPVESVTIEGEGTYTVAPDGTVTFTPNKDFTGQATGVTVKREDKNGTPITAKYTPVVLPVTPTGKDVTSIGEKGEKQSETPVFKAGTTKVNGKTVVIPIDETVAPSLEGADEEGKVVVPNEGTYTIDSTGKVTFTPEPNFVGKASGVTVKRVDENGTPVTATYTPTVLGKTSTKDVTSEGAKNTPQSNTPEFKGDVDTTVPPTFEDGKTTKEVPGQGTYTIDKDGKVTFTPKEDFVGTATPVEVVRKDKNGRTIKASYTPTVRPDTKFVVVGKDGKETELLPSKDGENPSEKVSGYKVVKTEKDEKGNTKHIYEKVTTKHVDSKGNPIPGTTTEEGEQPKKDIPGYKFVTTNKLPNGDTEHVYEKVITTFVDTEGHLITVDKDNNPVVSTEEGTTPKKDIPGYRFVETKKLPNGDTEHVYEKVTTSFKDKEGKEIPNYPTEEGENPKKDIPGYKFVETKKLPNGDTEHVYEKVTTSFKDKEGKEIPNYPTEEGENPKKDIPGYKFVETKKLPNGDTEHVYEKVKTTTSFVDESGKPVSPSEEGNQPKKDIPEYEFVKTTTDKDGNVTHVYRKVVKTTTSFVDESGKPVSPSEEGSQPKKDIPEYEFVKTTTDKDGNVTHVYRKVVKTTTSFVDESGKPVSPNEEGNQPKKDIPGYKFVTTKKLPNGDIEHVYEKVVVPTPTPTPFEYKVLTTYVDENGELIIPDENGSHPGKSLENYELVRTETDANGNVRNVYRKIQSPTPVQPVEPATPAMPEQPAKPEVPATPAQPVEPTAVKEAEGKRELPNTGTEDNASLAALGLLGVLSGFGLVARKKKED